MPVHRGRRSEKRRCSLFGSFCCQALICSSFPIGNCLRVCHLSCNALRNAKGCSSSMHLGAARAELVRLMQTRKRPGLDAILHVLSTGSLVESLSARRFPGTGHSPAASQPAQPGRFEASFCENLEKDGSEGVRPPRRTASARSWVGELTIWWRECVSPSYSTDCAGISWCTG